MKLPLALVLPLAVVASCAGETRGAPATPVAVQPPEEVVFQKSLPFQEKVVVLRRETPVEPAPSNPKTAPGATDGVQLIQATCTQAGRYSVFHVGADGQRQLLWRKIFYEAQTFDHGTKGDATKIVTQPKFFDVLVEPGKSVVLYELGSGPLWGEVVDVGRAKEKTASQPDWRMNTQLNISMPIGAPFVKWASVQGSFWPGALSVTMQKIDGQTSRFQWKNQQWQQQVEVPSP